MHVAVVILTDHDYGLDLAESLDAAGLDVTLYLSRSRAVAAVGYQDSRESLHELGLLPERVKVRLLQLPRLRDLRSFAAMWELAAAIRRDRVDVVHILVGAGEVWVSVLAWLLRGLPVVSTLIVPAPNVGESLPAWLLVAIGRVLTAASDVVVVNGRNQVELVNRLYRVPTERISYVPLGARTSATRWARGSASEEPATILFFGRAHPHKGLRYLIEAQPAISRRVPQALFLIAAHGEDLEACRALISEPDRFEIHEGFVPGAELPAYFQRASLVVLPYLSASTSGLLMTAYVFGKPVVASNVGCLPEYVEDGVTGVLVPPGDVPALADAVASLLEDDEKRRSMGSNARAWLARRQQQVAEATVSAYSSAVARHNVGVRETPQL